MVAVLSLILMIFPILIKSLKEKQIILFYLKTSQLVKEEARKSGRSHLLFYVLDASHTQIYCFSIHYFRSGERTMLKYKTEKYSRPNIFQDKF